MRIESVDRMSSFHVSGLTLGTGHPPHRDVLASVAEAVVPDPDEPLRPHHVGRRRPRVGPEPEETLRTLVVVALYDLPQKAPVGRRQGGLPHVDLSV